MKQNITLSLDKELIRKSKILAAKKDTSVSKLLAESLLHVLKHEDTYTSSKRNALTTMSQGFHLGGGRNWKRDDLYER